MINNPLPTIIPETPKGAASITYVTHLQSC